jgi:hypothetical protein
MDFSVAKKEKSAMYNMLLQFLSAIACIALPSDTIGSADILFSIGINALDALSTVPLKQHHQLHIFCDTGGTWPPDFNEFILSMSEEIPSEIWCKNNGASGMPLSKQKILFFGSKIQKAFQESKRFINNTLNRLWKNFPKELPSGITKSSMLFSVRQQAWPVEALELAKVSVRRNHNRVNKDAKFHISEQTEEIERNASLKPFKENWFPASWLVFVYLGLPTGSPNIHFSSGDVESVLNKKDEILKIRDLSSKMSRRIIDSTTAASFISPDNKKMKTEVHNISISRPKESHIVLLEKKIALMKDMNLSEELIRINQHHLLELYDNEMKDVI